MLPQVQDTGMTMDGFYVFLRIVEIMLELGLLWAAWLYLPKLLDACETIARSFIIDGPKEIANKIVERLAETRVVVTATGGGVPPETAESIAGAPATTVETVIEPMHVPKD